MYVFFIFVIFFFILSGNTAGEARHEQRNTSSHPGFRMSRVCIYMCIYVCERVYVCLREREREREREKKKERERKREMNAMRLQLEEDSFPSAL